LETAERLVHNYGIHDTTTELVDELDIFLMPSFNPDGANYSFYDVPMHRKNMTNYCDTDGARDQWAVEQGAQWVVDNNRNYGAYTLWDGYAGASFTCTSTTFAGPEELGPLSQPENQNLVWLVDTHDNIDFSMNIHSSGDYFMWSPGAYIAEGRVPTPRPSAMEEAYFWESSASILTAIKEHRGTVVTPARTGPIIDVLYSAAGNSGDHLWYLNDIYAWNFEVGRAGFQPAWPEAHQQAPSETGLEANLALKGRGMRAQGAALILIHFSGLRDPGPKGRGSIAQSEGLGHQGTPVRRPGRAGGRARSS
jgi:hypothetical protein